MSVFPPAPAARLPQPAPRGARRAGTTVAFPHSNSHSVTKEIEVSDQARQDLEAATAQETAFLAPYLDQSRVRHESAFDTADADGGAAPGPWRRNADGTKWLFTLPPELD